MTSVAIIGGYGGMGKLFARIFKKNGFDVTIAGPRPQKGNKVAKELGVTFEQNNDLAVKDADIVIITVPIRKTLEVISDVGPKLKSGSMIMDLTSVKKEPCAKMASSAPKDVEIVGCHPVFGPMVSEFSDQNFVLCPIREGKHFKKFISLLKSEGATVSICTPEEHDRAMGVVQGMTHFMLISAGIALKDLNFDQEESKNFSSPVYQLALDLVGRILGQDPKLYAEIQLNNSETDSVRDAYLVAAKRLDEIIKAGDEDGFVKEMTLAAKHFGDTDSSLKRTQKLLKK